VRSKTSFAVVLAVLCACNVALGQGSNGSILGTVTDQTRAVIPGVSVTTENTQTGISATTISNEAGVYSFPSIQPGVYRVIAELPGFKKLVNNDVKIDVGARISLNLTLEVGGSETVVEVSAPMEAAVALGTSSIGGMITGQAVTQLPLPSRNALDLIATQAGIVGENLAGARIGALNITRDGINVMEQHINQGVNSVVNTSTDLIQEVRVITSPADAEFGRGAGQVQMLTRSGTNEFHGSIFESHRNTVLNANTWFNNLRGTPRNVLIRNQFGGRLGGPIIRNKTFFHFLYDAQREVTKNSVTSVTFTDQARQGLFRFYPGVQNGNADAATPTVDINGNPVRPAAATDSLQTRDLFGRDPNRLTADRTGAVAAMLKLMPSPNNFRSGDGLNTAGYTWSRAGGANRDQYNIKIDHMFNDKNTLNVSYTRELQNSTNGFLAAPFPGGPSGESTNTDYFFSSNFTSTLSPTMVNELRIGGQHPDSFSPAPWDVKANESQILKLPSGQRYVIDFNTVDEPINQSNDTQGRMPPLYVLSDNLSLIRGRHSFKGGVELRFRSSLVTSSFDSMPRAEICGQTGSSALPCTAPVQFINSASITGLGQNEAAAQALLNNLVASLATVDQAFNSGKDLVFTGQYKNRHWQQREFSLFFKDDFKMRPGLTLNLGVRYEYYGVPYERHGRNAGVVNGSKGLFGITGTDWADLYQPGLQRGQPTDIELVGKNSPNPDKKLYNDDWNNFAPAVGLSWSLPWFGKDKTVLRAGYGIGYEIASLRLLNVVSGDQPGLRTFSTFRPARYMDLTSFTLPLTPVGQPLERVPFDDRVQTVRAYDTNLRTPYTQNWNLAIQHQLPGNFTVDLRYVANKGTKLLRGVTVNEVNVFESGILQAFNAVQAGGESVLLDRIFNGVNLGTGCVVDGSTVRAGACLRNNSNTRTFFAQGNVGAFANYLNTTTNYGPAGSLLTNGGLPANYIVANPQFLHSRVTGNFANSTYHSMQFDVTKRFAQGWTLQSNVTWSKALGEEEGAGQEMNDNYRNGRNRAIDKRLLSFHRDFVFRNSGTWELPFGPGQLLLRSSGGILARIVEQWQLGGIFNMFSGQPVSFGSNVSSFNAETDGTPNQLGDLPRTGVVTRVADGVVFFPSLSQVADPLVAGITNAQGLQARSTLRAIVDSSGRLVMANPAPGQVGTMGYRTVNGPGSFGLDVNLVKRVRIGEGKNFEFRVDAIDVLNTPHFEAPTTDNLGINTNTFGRITSATGNRLVVLNARISF
jgi:hypothetical protein